jgi:hypothetical protein
VARAVMPTEYAGPNGGEKYDFADPQPQGARQRQVEGAVLSIEGSGRPPGQKISWAEGVLEMIGKLSSFTGQGVLDSLFSANDVLIVGDLMYSSRSILNRSWWEFRKKPALYCKDRQEKHGL